MANMCSTGITFYSENKESLNLLKQKIDEIYNDPATQENIFARGWLGKYVIAFYPQIDVEKIYCRGYIDYIEEEVRNVDRYYSFSICTETAWTAKIGMWHKILNDFYPDIKIAYIAEECGGDYFVKWDESGLFYTHDYYLDICYPLLDGDVDYIDNHAFCSLEEICDWLEEKLPFDFKRTENINELEQDIISKLEDGEYSDECFCTIAEYAEIHPSDFDFYYD